VSVELRLDSVDSLAVVRPDPIVRRSHPAKHLFELNRAEGSRGAAIICLPVPRSPAIAGSGERPRNILQ